MTDPLTNRYLAIVSAFEGGVPFRYGTLSCIPGDVGGLSLGYLQASLSTGNVGKLLRAYAVAGGTLIPEGLIKLAELKSPTMNTPAFHDAWKLACADPKMHTAQDEFFASQFVQPAEAEARAMGITEPLGICLAVDGHVQGSFKHICGMIPPASENQYEWARNYVKTRRNWLATDHITALHTTVYRMDFFQQELDKPNGGNWKLETPLSIHGYKLEH